MKNLISFIRIALRSIKLGFAPKAPHAREVSLRQSRQEESAIPEVPPAELHERSQALSMVGSGNAAYAALCEKAVKARTTLTPAESLQRVIAFEKAAGIRLPDDYLFFITMVGYKGSENCWLLTLEDCDAGYWSETKLERDLCAPCLITPELQSLGAQWLDSLGVEDAARKWDQDEWDPMRAA